MVIDMKKIIIKMSIVCVVVLLFPFLITLIFSTGHNNLNRLSDFDFEIYYARNGKEETLDFDRYLIGVVAANMPAGYDMETLKAQAVIARTYALYNISLLKEDDPHKNSFSTSELGLSYISLSDMEQFWGSDDYLTYFTKIENSVYGTKDEILLYNDAIILPVFFHTGSGYTRNAYEAWGIDIPYLKSVQSKQDVTSTNYLKITEYSISNIINTLEQNYNNINLTEHNFFNEVEVTNRDSTNYVLKINLGNQTVSGEEFAKVLGLNSNHFYLEEYEGKVRIICTGVGHGVGFSQYGANAMANEGIRYREILKHYYVGAVISNKKDVN